MPSTAALVKGGRGDVEEKLQQLLDRNRKLEKELEDSRSKLASSAGDELAQQAQDIQGIKVLAAKIDGADAKGLRSTVDRLKDKLQSGVVVLGAVSSPAGH